MTQGLEEEVALRIEPLPDTKVAPISVGELRELLAELEYQRHQVEKIELIRRK